jgi:hypothetical protein
MLPTLQRDDIPPDIDRSKCDPGAVLFRHDRIYRHNLLRVNYTTYDVRRSQDVMNASTSHHNIMVLADDDDNSASAHPFKYARILGIYHVNALYVGHRMIDYQPRRMDFVWVRWYQNTGVVPNGWRDDKLDCIKFPSINQDDSFGFVDPADVLRGCHIIPRFSGGKVHADGKGLSHLAGDAEDWTRYYVNR